MQKVLRLAIPLGIFAALVPVYTLYSSLIGMDGNSDAANNVLQGWDMAHGRPLLAGWRQDVNSWMTNELLLYALVARVVGVAPSVVYISHALLYSAIIVLAGLLALGPRHDRRPWSAVSASALVGAMLLAVTRDPAGWMMLDLIDHLGTSIPVMLLLLVLDRAGLRWWSGLVAFAVLTWAVTSDALAIYVGVVPVALVAGVRAYFGRPDRRPLLGLAVGALAAVPADHLFKSVVEALGGATRNHPPPAVFAAPVELVQNLGETLNGMLVIFGAPVLGHRVADSTAALLHLAVFATAVAGWVMALRRLRALGLVDQILITVIGVNVMAFLVSPMPGGTDTAHEMLVVVPLSAVLAARMIAPRLTTPRTRATAAAGAATALILLGASLTGPATVDRHTELVGWLREAGLSDGLSGYWQAASVTVLSRDRVRIRPLINLNGQLHPYPFHRDDWYDPARADARFVVSDPQPVLPFHDLSPDLLRATFGPPLREAVVGRFVVRVYGYNLLTRLDSPT